MKKAKLTYKTLFTMPLFNAYTYVRDQLLEIMQPVYEYEYYGQYGNSYDYTPWQGGLYLALKNNWFEYEYTPWHTKKTFSNGFYFKKYNGSRYYSEYPINNFNALMMIYASTIGMMNCYSKAECQPGDTASNYRDLGITGSTTNEINSNFKANYGIVSPIEEYEAPQGVAIMGIRIQSTTTILYLSGLIHDYFNYMVKYNDENETFYVDDTFGGQNES